MAAPLRFPRIDWRPRNQGPGHWSGRVLQELPPVPPRLRPRRTTCRAPADDPEAVLEAAQITRRARCRQDVEPTPLPVSRRGHLDAQDFGGSDLEGSGHAGDIRPRKPHFEPLAGPRNRRGRERPVGPEGDRGPAGLGPHLDRPDRRHAPRTRLAPSEDRSRGEQHHGGEAKLRPGERRPGSHRPGSAAASARKTSCPESPGRRKRTPSASTRWRTPSSRRSPGLPRKTSPRGDSITA